MNRRRQAFTLLEVMAALLILAIAIFAHLEAQTSHLERTRRMREDAQAMALADSAMDEFLVSPDFFESGGSLDDRQSVTIDGISSAGYDIVRLTKEHKPLEEQSTIYVHPDEDPYYELSEEEKKQREENPFDPGKFVAVRIEVRRSSNGELLASLEQWFPVPMTEEEKAEAAGTGSTTTTGSYGSSGTSSGTGRTPGRTGTGTRPVGPGTGQPGRGGRTGTPNGDMGASPFPSGGTGGTGGTGTRRPGRSGTSSRTNEGRPSGNRTGGTQGGARQ